MSTPSTLEVAVELIENLNAFNGERCAQLLHDDFVQENLPETLSKIVPRRRNKTELIGHLDELKAVITELNVRTSVPFLTHTQ